MNLAYIFNDLKRKNYSKRITRHIFGISSDKTDKIEIYKENLELRVRDYTIELENLDEINGNTPAWNPNKIILGIQKKNNKNKLIDLIAEYAILEELSIIYKENTENKEKQVASVVIDNYLFKLYPNYKKMGGTKNYVQFDGLVSNVLKELD